MMAQFQVSSDVMRKVDTLLQRYGQQVTELDVTVIGAMGAGKSATANTLQGQFRFLEGCAADLSKEKVKLDDVHLTVVDTPGSWDSQVSSPGLNKSEFYIFVINLESPRFEQKTLDHLLSLKGKDGELIVGSSRCLTVLTHADKVLRDTSLESHLTKMEGNPLHTFLTINMRHRVLAINAAAHGYERRRHQKAILHQLCLAQAKGRTEGVERFAGIICTVALNLVFLLFYNCIFRNVDVKILGYGLSITAGQLLLLQNGIQKQVSDFMAGKQNKGIGTWVRLILGLIFHLLFNLFWLFIFVFVSVCKMVMGKGPSRKGDQHVQPFVNIQGFLTGVMPKHGKSSKRQVNQ